MIFLILLAIPLVVILAFYFTSKKISWKELVTHIVFACIVAGTSASICYFSNVSDVEVWNGVVSSKKKEVVPCSHSYSCNCRESCSGEGSNRSCNTICDTCYEHSYDIDWNVYTSNNEVVNIERLDRQGKDQPPRWTNTVIGEPTTIAHRYDNYIKGSPDSLFCKTGQVDVYKSSLLEYPHIHDYYRMNRLLVESGPVTNQTAWNTGLSDINARMGARKQVNAMVVITTKPREYFFALEEYWIGGKKNDAVLVIGVDNNLQPVWSEVMAWVLDNKFKVILKEEILKLPIIDAPNVLPVFEHNITSFYQRKPMHDFEYLKASIVPTTAQWTISILIGLALAISLGLYFHHYDPFGDEYKSQYRYRRW